VLKSVGLLGRKNNTERGKLVKEYKVLMTQVKAIEKKLEA
jgi:hypothetical protein